MRKSSNRTVQPLLFAKNQEFSELHLVGELDTEIQKSEEFRDCNAAEGNPHREVPYFYNSAI